MANSADKVLGAGKKGTKLGTQKHKYAEELGKRYQKMTGDKPHLKFEERFKGGREWRPKDGLKDHVKPDVYDPKINKVLDHKFGDAKLKTPQINRYQQQMPRGVDNAPATIQQIKPTV